MQLTYLEEENFLLKARLAQRENLATDQLQKLKEQVRIHFFFYLLVAE